MSKLSKVLRTDMSGGLQALAQLIQSKGRGKDTILAHITPEEAQLLKARGGRGSTNPDTGLPEFESDYQLDEVLVTAERPQTGGGFGVGTDYSALTTPSWQQTTAPASWDLPKFSYTAPIAVQQPKKTGTTGTNFLPPALQPTGGLMPLQAAPTSQPDELTEVTPTARTGTKGIEKPQSFGSKALESLGGVGGLARLGLTGYLGYKGKQQGEQAAQEVRQLSDEQKKMALPYQTRGQEMVGAAARGELTPQGMQSLQNARAQMAQEAESRGGIGVQQSAAQLEDLRQRLLQQQMTYGLQIANIGDNIAAGAIQTAMQADQMVNQATQNFYAMLGQFAASGNYSNSLPNQNQNQNQQSEP